MQLRQAINLVEAKGKDKLELIDLPYSQTALAPVMSAQTIKNHYGKLARGYVDRYNNNEGDAGFNEAGAYLHNIFFALLREPRSGNRPSGPVLALINRRYGDFAKFQEEVAKTAMGIQGSGWVYMTRTGDIRTITNHQIRKDIALLIDWWEHAWALDYGTDKRRYIKNIWRIIDWDAVNIRL